MFVFKGKEYSSKAEVVRELYNAGEVTLSAQSKKDVAVALEMTIQTVHATIMKILGKNGCQKKSEKVHKIIPAITQANDRLNQKIARVRSSEGAIFINDKSDEVKVELMKDVNCHAIKFAPNQYGLPICNPPLYVIDENYDPEWIPTPEELIEKPW
jgi:hypothetical protein